MIASAHAAPMATGLELPILRAPYVQPAPFHLDSRDACHAPLDCTRSRGCLSAARAPSVPAPPEERRHVIYVLRDRDNRLIRLQIHLDIYVRVLC